MGLGRCQKQSGSAAIDHQHAQDQSPYPSQQQRSPLSASFQRKLPLPPRRTAKTPPSRGDKRREIARGSGRRAIPRTFRRRRASRRTQAQEHQIGPIQNQGRSPPRPAPKSPPRRLDRPEEPSGLPPNPPQHPESAYRAAEQVGGKTCSLLIRTKRRDQMVVIGD